MKDAHVSGAAAANADPVELASCINEVITRLRNTVRNTRSIGDELNKDFYSHISALDKAFFAFIVAVNDVSVLDALLQETSTNLLSAPFPPPRSAQTAVQQCLWLLTALDSTLKPLRPLLSSNDNGKSDRPMARLRHARTLVRIPSAISEFCRLAERVEAAVTRLRNIIADSATHRLLDEARLTFEKLSRQDDGQVVGAQPAEPGMDPYLFDVAVIREGPDGCEWKAARAKMDTFADCNITTMGLLKRIGLETQVKAVEDEIQFSLVGGHKFIPKTKVTLSWRARTSLKTLETEFFISESEPFDLLLGQGFMAEHYGDVVQRDRRLNAILSHASKKKRTLQNADREERRKQVLSDIAAGIDHANKECDLGTGNPGSNSVAHRDQIPNAAARNMSAGSQYISGDADEGALERGPATRSSRVRPVEERQSIEGARIQEIDEDDDEPSANVGTSSAVKAQDLRGEVSVQSSATPSGPVNREVASRTPDAAPSRPSQGTSAATAIKSSQEPNKAVAETDGINGSGPSDGSKRTTNRDGLRVYMQRLGMRHRERGR